MIHTGKPSQDTGKVSTDRLTEGASVSRNKRMQTVSRPRLTGSKRTTFQGAKRRCKSE